ncbi:MAG: FIST C-terminal domain-containing protein [Elusimicrobia bacterium]|nr:FIST C-terminal domain-containing protein [Elusimicrobiota bacterium]
MAMRFGVGFSDAADPFAAAVEAARRAKASVAAPELAVVFGSHRYDQARLLAGLGTELDPAIITGGSSYLEVSPAGVTRHSVVVLLLSGLDGPVRSADVELVPDAAANAARLGEALSAALGPGKGPERPLGLYFGSFTNGWENEMLGRLQGRFPGLPLFGGLACGDYDLGLSHPEFWTNHQYGGGKLRRQSARLLSLGLPAGQEVGFSVDRDWTLIGPPVRFTRCDKERVFEIDGIPVFDFYRQFLGERHSADFFESMIQRFGFAVAPEGSMADRAVLKLPVECDFGAGSISFHPSEDLAGRSGRLIQVSRPALIAGARRAAEKCRDALGGRTPELVFMVSCCSRGAFLNSKVDAELAAVREVFGPSVPVFGYYSGGEVFPSGASYQDAAGAPAPQDGSRFHTMTLGLMAFAHIGSSGTSETSESLTPTAPTPEQELKALRRMLERSEKALDDSDSFMSNLSRKSYEDGEKLKEQNRELDMKNQHNLKLQEVVHRYTPHDVWRRLGDNVARGQYELADEAGHFAFMFLDVKGFTGYSEKHSAAEVVAAINDLFKPATEIIYRRGGDVDKYIGDCIFAAFPDPKAAVQSGLEILAMFQDRKARGNPFSVRIGINAGRAVRANVGSTARREYTYIGDAVNLAQRLESNCTPGRLLLSQDVYDQCGLELPPPERKTITVKGKLEAISVCEIAP